MLPLIFFILIGEVFTENVIYYDTFTGRTLSPAEYQEKVKANLTFWCTGSYKPCDPNARRLADVTCNNLQYPYMGASHTPSSHLLPLKFGKDNNPVKTKSGEEMPLARKVRLSTLIEGTIPDQRFTALVPYYLLFVIFTVASIHDSVNYVHQTKTCCLPGGKNNPICAPMEILPDDTVHQFSGIRCMNLTKPLTYQNLGCTRNTRSIPERVTSASNFLDLSTLYGFTNEYRTMTDGYLQVEEEGGIVWPISSKNRSNEFCFTNDYPRETRCSKRDQLNGIIGQSFFSIIFWRLHNYIAKQLKHVNPSWNDEKLFGTAKDLNIAISTQIFYYELLSELMGNENLINDGVLLKNGGLKDEYNSNLPPQVVTDFLYGLRWVHTIQPGMTKQYDLNGNYLKQCPSVNLTLRTGYYAVDNNMVGITQGTFRQPMGKSDHVVDALISERGFNDLQVAFDIPAADLAKGGLIGLQHYVKYREYCTGRKYRTFSDLSEDIDPERIDMIKNSYNNVEDVPLMVGIWLERHIPGGYIPKTLYCMVTKQLNRFKQYDRHWYERPNRPYAFNSRQLAEIRKASIAWVLCSVGDSVTKIQPKAFLLESFGNRMTSCQNISKINFEAWRENFRS